MEEMKNGSSDIRQQPSINTEPKTLNEMTLEEAMITAQEVFAKHPSEDFTKDAVDTATREAAPAEDASDDLVLKAPVMATEGPASPPPSPAM